MAVELGDTVVWLSDPKSPAKVIGIFREPAVVLEYPSGHRQTVGIGRVAVVRFCKCGHVDGQHFDEVRACDSCECAAFRLAVPQ